MVIDGTPLVRQIGFRMQTTGTFPALHDNKHPPKKKTRPKGKRGC